MRIQSDKIMIHEQKKNIRQIRWLIFWVMISITVVTLAIDAVFSFLPRPTPNLNYIRMAVTHILAVFIPLIIFFKIRNPKSQKINFRLNKIPLNQILVIILLAIAGQFIMAVLEVPMRMLLQNILNIPTVAPRNITELIFGILSIAILPVILEEILFRGVIFGGTENQSRAFALMFSMFAFALLHSNVFSFLGYIFLGIMTVMVMLRSNSLYAAIIFHFINNLTALMIQYLSYMEVVNNQMVIWLFLGAVIVFILMIFIFKNITPNAEKSKSKNSMPLLLRNIFSIPIILCIIISVVMQYFRFFT